MPMLIYIYTEFQRAEATFKHQRVFDLQRKIIVPWNDFTEDISIVNKDINVGPDFESNVIAINICTGKIDPFTQKLFIINNNKTSMKRSYDNIGEADKSNYPKPYWNMNTKNWSIRLPSCTMTDMEPVKPHNWDHNFKNLASES